MTGAATAQSRTNSCDDVRCPSIAFRGRQPCRDGPSPDRLARFDGSPCRRSRAVRQTALGTADTRSDLLVDPKIDLAPLVVPASNHGPRRSSDARRPTLRLHQPQNRRRGRQDVDFLVAQAGFRFARFGFEKTSASCNAACRTAVRSPAKTRVRSGMLRHAAPGRTVQGRRLGCGAPRDRDAGTEIARSACGALVPCAIAAQSRRSPSRAR